MSCPCGTKDGFWADCKCECHKQAAHADREE